MSDQKDPGVIKQQIEELSNQFTKDGCEDITPLTKEEQEMSLVELTESLGGEIVNVQDDTH